MAAGDGAVRVPPTPQTPPRLGLLPSVIRPTPESLGMSDPLKWLNGIIVESERCLGDVTVDAGYAWEDCTATTPQGDGPIDGSRGVRRTWVPWQVNDGDECSADGWASQDFQGRAKRTLVNNESRKVELELWSGRVVNAAGLPNNWLANPASAADLGTAPAAYALAELVQYLADTIPGRGMIHAMPRLVSLWDEMHLLRREGNLLLENTADHIVVPGTGYTGFGIDADGQLGEESGTPGDISGSTAYATGMVYLLEDIIVVTPTMWSEAFDRDQNLITFQAERTVLPWWDGCAHGALDVDHANPCTSTTS